MENTETPRRGHCLCGRTRFEFRGKPNWVAYCHCESCRRNTASPATAFFGVNNDNWTLTGDRPATYESSPGVTRSFCATCGSPFAFETEDLPHEIHFYVSLLEDPEDLPPRGHVHVGEQLSWFETADDLPRYLASGTGATPDWHGPRAKARK